MQSNDGPFFDIIHNVPYDILINIIDHLDLKEKITLLDTSQTLRDRVSDYRASWSCITLAAMDLLTLQDISLLNHVAHHIEDLVLNGFSTELYNAIYDNIGKGHFSRLQKLVVKYHDTQCGDDILNSILQVASTLKELIVDATFSESNQLFVPFKTVLSKCQKLERFEYRHSIVASSLHSSYSFTRQEPIITPASAGHWEENIKLHRHHTLRSLLLSFGDKYEQQLIKENELDEFISLFPNLDQLTLIGVSTSEAVLNAMHRHCKSLTCLKCNENFPTSTGDLEDITSSYYGNLTTKKKGLRQIAIQLDNTKTLEKLLVKHATTIESVFFNLAFKRSITSFSETLFLDNNDENQNTNFSQLRYFSANSIERTVNLDEPFSRILRKSPNLITLQLSRCVSSQRSIVNVITRDLPHLRTLRIISNMYRIEGSGPNRMDVGIATLLEGLATRSRSNKSLESIFLSPQSFRDLKHPHFETIVRSLANIQSLKSIELSAMDGIGYEQDKLFNEEFCQKLPLLPHLEMLKFTDMECINDQSIHYFSSIKTLTCLVLINTKNVTKEAVMRELDFSKMTVYYNFDIFGVNKPVF